MARIVDDRGRLFGKINIVDLLVLLAVVGLALFVVLRFAWPAEEVPVRVTLMVEMYDASQLAALDKLGSLEDENGRTIGTIDKVEPYERAPVALRVAGEEITIDQTNKPTVLIYVSGVAKISSGGYHVGPLDANVGVNLTVAGPGWEGKAYVVEVEQTGTVE